MFLYFVVKPKITEMKNLKFAIIRKDILDKGESVPIGNEYYGQREPLEYRYKGEIFQVRHLKKWKEAQSIDFEFIEVKVITKPLSPHRKDSFWYYDQTIASVTINGRTFYASAIGEIRVFFNPNGETYRNDMAVKEAKSLELDDKSLNKLSEHDGWQNNNWFTISEDTKKKVKYYDEVSYNYDEAIITLIVVALEETA